MTAEGSLAGRIALVTGAARGLGFEIAQRLAERGATVWLNGRDVDALDTAAARIGAVSGAMRMTPSLFSRPARSSPATSASVGNRARRSLRARKIAVWIRGSSWRSALCNASRKACGASTNRSIISLRPDIANCASCASSSRMAACTRLAVWRRTPGRRLITRSMVAVLSPA